MSKARRHPLDDPITDRALLLCFIAAQLWSTWGTIQLGEWANFDLGLAIIPAALIDGVAFIATRSGSSNRLPNQRGWRIRPLASVIAALCFLLSFAANITNSHVRADPLEEPLKLWLHDALSGVPVVLLIASLVLRTRVAAWKVREVARETAEREQAEREAAIAREAAEREEAERTRVAAAAAAEREAAYQRELLAAQREREREDADLRLAEIEAETARAAARAAEAERVRAEREREREAPAGGRTGAPTRTSAPSRRAPAVDPWDDPAMIDRAIEVVRANPRIGRRALGSALGVGENPGRELQAAALQRIAEQHPLIPESKLYDITLPQLQEAVAAAIAQEAANAGDDAAAA